MGELEFVGVWAKCGWNVGVNRGVGVGANIGAGVVVDVSFGCVDSVPQAHLPNSATRMKVLHGEGPLAAAPSIDAGVVL